MNRRTRRLVAPLAVAALFGVACGGGDASDSAASSTTTTAAALGPGPASKASVLRSELTALLQEHVFLNAIAIRAGLAGGDQAAAAAVLGQNSEELADLIGSVHGQAAGAAFLPLWNQHLSVLADYARASAAGDEAGAEAAEASLDTFVSELGVLFEAANPYLPEPAVVKLMATHLSAVTAAIDAQVAGDDDQFDKVRTAAEGTPVIGLTIAAAMAKQQPDTFTGGTDSKGSNLRVELTDVLQEHVYLAAMATGAAIGGSGFDSAAETLDTNSESVANVIKVTYGEEAGTAFLALWRKHIAMFVDYTKGAASGDTAAKAKAAGELRDYAPTLAAFLGSASPDLDEAEVASGLSTHASSLLKVIDAQAAGDPQQHALLRTAAGHMPMFAELLAEALAQQFPDRFAS